MRKPRQPPSHRTTVPAHTACPWRAAQSPRTEGRRFRGKQRAQMGEGPETQRTRDPAIGTDAPPSGAAAETRPEPRPGTNRTSHAGAPRKRALTLSPAAGSAGSGCTGTLAARGAATAAAATAAAVGGGEGETTALLSLLRDAIAAGCLAAAEEDAEEEGATEDEAAGSLATELACLALLAASRARDCA